MCDFCPTCDVCNERETSCKCSAGRNRQIAEALKRIASLQEQTEMVCSLCNGKERVACLHCKGKRCIPMSDKDRQECIGREHHLITRFMKP